MAVSPILTNEALTATSAVSSKFMQSIGKVFTTDLKRFPPKVGVALSGGADSMTVLTLLVKLKEERLKNLQIHAITINHNIRPESAEEARDVGKVISQYPVHHHILNIDEGIKGNQIEKKARDRRYELMLQACEKLGIEDIFMGHHRDDQLETFLMRLKNNSTLFGLRSMLPQSNYPMISPLLNLQVVRPLLDVDKKQILAYCRENGLKWFEDSTNFMPDLTARNFYRYLLKDEKDRLPPELYRSKLLDSLSKVQSFNNIVGMKLHKLHDKMYREGYALFDPKTISLKLFLPKEVLKKYDSLTLDRYIFLELYGVTASKNFFHEFTKIDGKYASINNQDLTKKRSLIEDIMKGNKPSRFTLLKCQFDVTKKDSGVEILVTRAKEDPRRGYHVLPVSIPVGDSDWVFFDNRVFFKFHNKDPANAGNYKIEIYKDDFDLSMLKRSFSDFADFKKILNNYNVPVLIRKGEEGAKDEIVGFPTLKKYADTFNSDKFQCEISLKRPLL